MADYSRRRYEDFDPVSELKSEKESDTLCVHLPGFRKEQLKASVTSSRILISGERPIEDNKWLRFHKEIRVSSNIDMDGITSKFLGGILYLKQPKLNTFTATEQADAGEITAAEAEDTRQQESPPVSQPQPQELPPVQDTQIHELPPVPQPQMQESPPVSQPQMQESPPVSQPQVQELPPEPQNQLQDLPPEPQNQLQDLPPEPQPELQELAPEPQTQLQEEVPSEGKKEGAEERKRISELDEQDKLVSWELIRKSERMKKFAVYVFLLMIILLGCYTTKMFETFTKKQVEQQSDLVYDHQEL